MAQFRKKPVTIEAMEWDGTAAGATPIIDWILGNGGTAGYDDPPGEEPFLWIQTLEGRMGAYARYQVIRGVQGEFYACRPDIFEATYDLADA